MTAQLNESNYFIHQTQLTYKAQCHGININWFNNNLDKGLSVDQQWTYNYTAIDIPLILTITIT